MTKVMSRTGTSTPSRTSRSKNHHRIHLLKVRSPPARCVLHPKEQTAQDSVRKSSALRVRLGVQRNNQHPRSTPGPSLSPFPSLSLSPSPTLVLPIIAATLLPNPSNPTPNPSPQTTRKKTLTIQRTNKHQPNKATPPRECRRSLRRKRRRPGNCRSEAVGESRSSTAEVRYLDQQVRGYRRMPFQS